MNTSSAETRRVSNRSMEKIKKAKCDDSLRINITLHGQPAIQARELRQAGFVQNNGDLLRQAISTLYQKFVDERLKVMRLKALERTGEDEF
jgi:pheromone shutdown protein TraB